MKQELKLGDLTVKSGEIGKGSLGGVELADGSEARVPLVGINGTSDGPILTVVSGIHGTELSGIGALQEVVRSVKPSELKGALIGIPGGNPLAFRIGAYTTPIDGKNLSGPWYLPAVNQEKANITERMAYCINLALEKADYVIDMHANPLPSIPFVLTDLEICPNEEMREKVKKMADAFGVTVINWPRTQATSIRDICVKNQKPAITPELAGNIYMWDEINSVGAIGIANVMKSVGMLEGTIAKQKADVVIGDLTFYGWLYAQRGGFMYVKKRPGVKIKKDEVAIEIVNVYGDLVQEVIMPINGYCWSFTGGVGGSHAVSEGDKLAYVFTEVKELGGKSAFVEKPV